MPLSPFLGRSIILFLPSSPSIQSATVGCYGSPSTLPKFVSMANLPPPPKIRIRIRIHMYDTTNSTLVRKSTNHRPGIHHPMDARNLCFFHKF
eukprot:6182465-Pyramimonas_sp.AAC.1